MGSCVPLKFLLCLISSAEQQLGSSSIVLRRRHSQLFLRSAAMLIRRMHRSLDRHPRSSIDWVKPRPFNLLRNLFCHHITRRYIPSIHPSVDPSIRFPANRPFTHILLNDMKSIERKLRQHKNYLWRETGSGVGLECCWQNGGEGKAWLSEGLFSFRTQFCRTRRLLKRLYWLSLSEKTVSESALVVRSFLWNGPLTCVLGMD